MIVTSGTISSYRTLIKYTISDLKDSGEWLKEISPSETDKGAFRSICGKCQDSSSRLQPRTVGTTGPNIRVFCTPEEAFSNKLDWERKLDACSRSFKDKFESAVKGISDTSSAADIVKHFVGLKPGKNTQRILIPIGGDLTKPEQIIDLCGVLLFYDINIRYEVSVTGRMYILQ